VLLSIISTVEIDLSTCLHNIHQEGSAAGFWRYLIWQ
jgi:hypothetical protein